MGSTPSLYALLRNARAYTQQWILPRAGIAAINATPFDQTNIHSIKKLNDKLSSLFPRVYGAGTKVYIGEGTAAIDVGYSGNPLSMFAFRPEGSPQAWMYIADSVRMRKVRSDGLNHSVGIEPPLVAPTVGLGVPAFQIISDFEAIGTWTNGGTAGALSVVSRLNTTIARILYDAGSTGWANIQPTVMNDQVQKGMFIIVNGGGGSVETVLVDDVFQAMSPTTIGSIAYDSGTTGLCTIQPVAAAAAKSNYPYQPGLGTPPSNPRGDYGNPGYWGGRPIRSFDFTAREGGRGAGGGRGPGGGVPGRPPNPPPTRTPSTKPVGAHPNSLVRINAGGVNDETVRVLSIAVGKDGQVSFRCSTTGTHIATETLTGLASVRAYCLNTHAATETLVNNCFQTSVAAGTGTVSIVTPFNIAVVSSRPVQETDEIHISLKVDHPEFITEIRVLFDVDATSNDFAHNYFYHAIRQSDMQQATSSGQTNLAARQAALNRAVMQRYGRPINPRMIGPNSDMGDFSGDQTGVDVEFADGGAIGSSAQLRTGASQWTEFKFKVNQLTRVGGDHSRNLGNVGAIRIQFVVTSAVVANIDALWIGGTYGPDISTIGSPVFYRYRARSKVTGAKSLAGPPTRFGIEPHRQRVVGTMPQHPNASADTLDIFRFGGTLAQWYYTLSIPNSANPSFIDDLDDVSVQINPILDNDAFQPFPTIDLPKSGVVNVVGTRVTWVSGSVFNTSWYPGSQININGIYYSLYAQPFDTTHLEIIENAGTQTGAAFFMNNATLLGQPMPSWWGPYAEGTAAFFFACGDLNQPGVLFLTNGNDPDAASDVLQIEVCSPSEPLVNGCIYDSTPYVFSSEGLFRLYANIGGGSQLFIPKRVPNTKGLFARWALATGRFIYALGKDGIYKTDGASYISITNDDLALLFPHDGRPGQQITLGTITVYPPDMTQTAKLRLSCYDDHLYFDFVDSQGTQRTLVYNENLNIWGVDDYSPTVSLHYGDEGEGAHGIICGGTDGRAYSMTGTTDSGANFPVEMRFPQIGELATAHHLAPDGIIALISNSPVNLIINVDGVDNTVVIPSTAGKFIRVFQMLPAVKGKLLAFALTANQGFSLNQRECQIQVGAWGRGQSNEALGSGDMGPVNPFSSLRRAYAGKVP